jgi:hypothetical protein
MKKILLPILLISLTSCSGKKKQKVDMLVLGAAVYTMNADSLVASGFAVEDGKILDVGLAERLQAMYTSENVLHLEGKYVYPGFIDPHSHFYGLAQSLSSADLRGSANPDEMVALVKQFAGGRSFSVIYGRGWDQNRWPLKEFPDNTKLNESFPDVPVFLSRIDGHAALVNQKALDLAGITPQTKVSGGEIVLKDGKLTGVLIDNAVDLVTKKLPAPGNGERTEMLRNAQQHCFRYGLTTVCDAGVDKELADLYDTLQKQGKLDIRIYAMLNPSSAGWLLQNGPLKTEKLDVRSVKFYMDGSMGSRGACLLQDYSDQPGHTGFLLNSPDTLRALAKQLFDKKLQLNVHCIGDSANRIVLKIMAEIAGNDTTTRWRIEHVQLIDEKDITYFSHTGFIPSMQPTHATSDADWVDERLGADRLHYAYALRTLRNTAGIIALGTDFPVEEVNPFYTFYAAITRKNPVTGKTYDWLQLEKLSRYDALCGMTRWAAYAQFEENEKGTLDPGKWADFIVLDKDLMTIGEDEIPKMEVLQTYVNGKKVYEK